MLGIIAEYDPFHRGHAYHLDQARKLTGQRDVAVVISPAFTQRGLPALFSTRDRARMALANGCDMVLAMPQDFAMASAERFALGGVSILSRLNGVSHLAFGCELEDLAQLRQFAEVLDHPSSRQQELLKESLAQGQSMAAAYGAVLKDAFSQVPEEVLRSPNLLLGVSYLRALAACESPIKPVIIPRKGAYHQGTSLKPGEMASASGVRAAFLRGDWQQVADWVPGPTMDIMRDCALSNRIHRPEALDQALLTKLLTMDKDQLAGIAGFGEGLDDRVRKVLPQVTNREELAQQVKTRRYPMGRIQRALSMALLGRRTDQLSPIPAFVRLMGFRRTAEGLLSDLQQEQLPLISRPARHSVCAFDMLSESVWRLGCPLPPAGAFEESMLVWDDNNDRTPPEGEHHA